MHNSQHKSVSLNYGSNVSSIIGICLLTRSILRKKKKKHIHREDFTREKKFVSL